VQTEMADLADDGKMARTAVDRLFLAPTWTELLLLKRYDSMDKPEYLNILCESIKCCVCRQFLVIEFSAATLDVVLHN